MSAADWGRGPLPVPRPWGRVTAATVLWAVLPAALGCGAGCRGAARIELATLNFSAIDPPAPQVARVTLHRCTWWQDEAGQVWIAMERREPLVVVPGQFDFRLSLVLAGLPAGRAREYRVAERELRAAVRLGPIESRYESILGIVALYRAGGDRLRGSFRLLVGQQSSRLLGGWTEPVQQLMLGTFEAVPDSDGRGRLIAAETEAAGWDRPPPASQPAPGTAR